MDVVRHSVVVIIDAGLSVSLLDINPHVFGEVVMVEFNACVDDGNNHLGSLANSSQGRPT